MTNKDRAELAMQAVETNQDYSQNELHTNITDLLANIMHLCANDDMDFDALVVTASIHYQYELDNNDDDEHEDD